MSGLIFDMDGTLIDSSADIASSLNFTLTQLGMESKTNQQVRNLIGDGMRTLLERATGNKEDAFIQKAIEIFRAHYLEHCTDATTLYPNTLEILNHFRAKSMALVSNKPYDMVVKILNHFRLHHTFKIVLGGESTKEKKPHPEPVLKSISTMGTTPESTIIIGDGTTDIQAGKSAGTWTCGVTYGFKTMHELEPYHPDFLIDRIEELKSIIQ